MSNDESANRQPLSGKDEEPCDTQTGRGNHIPHTRKSHKSWYKEGRRPKMAYRSKERDCAKRSRDSRPERPGIVEPCMGIAGAQPGASPRQLLKEEWLATKGGHERMRSKGTPEEMTHKQLIEKRVEHA